MIGQTLGHYRVIEKIGAGGMGVVYRARDERLTLSLLKYPPFQQREGQSRGIIESPMRFRIKN